jgi:hypothetical protein
MQMDSKKALAYFPRTARGAIIRRSGTAATPLARGAAAWLPAQYAIALLDSQQTLLFAVPFTFLGWEKRS